MPGKSHPHSRKRPSQDAEDSNDADALEYIRPESKRISPRKLQQFSRQPAAPQVVITASRSAPKRRIIETDDEDEDESANHVVSGPSNSRNSVQSVDDSDDDALVDALVTPQKATQTRSSRPKSQEDWEVSQLNSEDDEPGPSTAVSKAPVIDKGKQPARAIPHRRRQQRQTPFVDVPFLSTKEKEKYHLPKSIRAHLNRPGHRSKVPSRKKNAMEMELEMDEPERFASSSRLRQRNPTKFQRGLRKYENYREGVEEASEEERPRARSRLEEIEEEDSSFESEPDDFIADSDDDQAVGLPTEFSVNAGQRLEFKFKIVYEYFVTLVIKKPTIVPLPGDNFYAPRLRELQDRMKGFRDMRVRSQIWRPNFIKALQTYPEFETKKLGKPHKYCNACNRTNQTCHDKVEIYGEPYDRYTLIPIPQSDSESDSESDDEDKLPQEFYFGHVCHARAKAFHLLAHWEYHLHRQIREKYHDLLRAKSIALMEMDSDRTPTPSSDELEEDREEIRRKLEYRRQKTMLRVVKLQQSGDLPSKVKNVGQVTEWMAKMGYIDKAFQRFRDMDQFTRDLGIDR